MCGIVGYIGKYKASDVLIDGLEKLEYRGYDSSGIAINFNNHIKIIKSQGKLKNLKEKIKELNLSDGNIGIGHTRWATHGEPNEVNAHPHHSLHNLVTIVHNGIIENYLELRKFLIQNNFEFYSDTDTEVVANLIEYETNLALMNEKNAKIEKNCLKIDEILIKSIKNALNRVQGSYALVILFENLDDRIFVAKKESPLIIGVQKENIFVASDVPALLKHTRNIIYLDNNELGVLKRDDYKFFDDTLTEIEKKVERIDWDINAAEKNGYEHFMIKEIFEEPRAIQDTIHSICNENFLKPLEEIELDEAIFKNTSNIIFIGCGSAFHVGLGLSYIFEKLTKIPSRAILASEFKYTEHIFDKNTLIISISQSGETADTLSGIMIAKKLGLKTLSIVNVMGSNIARESDYVIYTKAGMEIAVATTKAYSCQMVAGYILALYFAKYQNILNDEKINNYLSEITKIPKIIENLLKNQENIKKFAENIYNVKNIYMIGRNIDYSICRESALKMKEVSYISTESFPAGELKHGTISLIEPNTYVFGFFTQQNIKDKTMSNIMETKCRGANIVGIGFEESAEIQKEFDHYFVIPEIDPLFSNVVAIVPMQLLSYYVAVLKNNDVDKPRNLAKSVTVE